MHFICRPFLGQAQESSWSQYWENEPEDRQVFSQKGHLFALLNIISDEGNSSSDLGHQLIEKINTQYFSSKTESITSALKSTIEDIVNKPEYDLNDISLTIAIVHHSHLYIAMYNSGYGFLVREGRVSKIISGLTGQVTIISGNIQDNDKLLICTSGFYANMTWDKIKSFLSLKSVQEIEESVLSILYTLPQQSALASLLIGIYEDKETEVPTIDDIVPDQHRQPTPQTPSVYISHLDSTQVKRRRHLNIILAILILAALSVSIYFGSKRNQQSRLESDYQSIKLIYQAKIDNAKAVRNINLTESQTLAKAARDEAMKLQSLKVHSEETTQLITVADQILSQTGSAESYKPEPFYDTTLITSSAEFSKVLLSNNNLVLLDTTSGHIDRIDISTKSQQKIIYDEQLKNTKSITENNGKLYLLIGTQVYYLDGSTLSQVLSISENIKDFVAGQIHMWNGSLYVLGQTNNATQNIWKFTPSGAKFGGGQVWIKDPQGLPLGISSFAINGSVWTLKKTGEITPYNRGVSETFKSPGVSSLSQASNLVTTLSSQIIAFTEKDSVVYVYRKDGTTASSYNFGQLKILNLAIDSASNRLFVLCADKKIYQVSL